jgi:hypothetical protein
LHDLGKLPEPWLRGPLADVSPLLAPPLCGFQQVREDLAVHTHGLSAADVWSRPQALESLGFQLRHIAGSVDRLTTYLEGQSLGAGQLKALAAEGHSGAGLDELLAAVDASLQRAETVIRAIDPATFSDARWVGRMRLPTTVIGLLVHIAEHTQRHLGQAISAAKLARAR